LGTNPEPTSVNAGMNGSGAIPVQTGRGDRERVPFRRAVITGCSVLLDVQVGSANASAARAVALRMAAVRRTDGGRNQSVGDNVAAK